MNAFLFSGQGSQAPGMGVELCEASAGARKVFETASQVLGFDLLKLCREGTAEELAATEVAQPGIMAVSLAAYTCLTEAGVPFGAVAGHSLGEYAAMVASGMLSMEEGFALIKARAAAMGKCAAQSGGSMAAILGSDEETVAAVCAENCPVPVVRHGVMDEFGRSGKALEVLEHYGLTAEVMAEKAERAIALKKK